MPSRRKSRCDLGYRGLSTIFFPKYLVDKVVVKPMETENPGFAALDVKYLENPDNSNSVLLVNANISLIYTKASVT